MNDYDLIVIGGGAAAFSASHFANMKGKKTLIVNDSGTLPLGGTCVNVGCVPSKIMLYQGEMSFYSERFPFRSLSMHSDSDFVEALKETRRSVEMFRVNIYESVAKRYSYVDIVDSIGSFSGDHSVVAGGEEYYGKNILIATGGKPHIPNIPGLDKVEFHTYRSIFNIRRSPHSAIILGGGPQALEFAQIFRHFGMEVSIVQRSERLLSKFEPVLGHSIKSYFLKEGINVFTSSSISRVESSGGRISVFFSSGEKDVVLESDLLFVATGIEPNTDSLNCEIAGVDLDRRGFVKVNRFMESSSKGIYAAGDVTGILPLETVAARQGHLSAKNMFSKKKEGMNYSHVPKAVFTHPQVASVGLSEKECNEKFGDCLSSSITLSSVERAGIERSSDGVVKMVVDKRNRKILGVHMVSPHASEVITSATYAVVLGMTTYELRDIVHVFPTFSEMLKKVAQSFDMPVGSSPCCVE